MKPLPSPPLIKGGSLALVINTITGLLINRLFEVKPVRSQVLK